MIVETLVSFGANLIQGLFSALQIIELPFDALNFLLDILCYGTWVIGADLLGIIVAVIVGWYTFRLTAGVVLFVWRLLPLT